MSLRYWLHLVAISVGTFVGLTFSSCAGIVASDAYEAVAKVKVWQVGRTIGELPTFWLSIDGATVTVMGDAQVPLIRYLAELDGKTVRITVEPRVLDEVKRASH